ncbi:MAG: DUF3800 domain-containing protein [Minisyncoccia bacterium]
MKFVYIDESGTGSEPYAVMVGIIVDTQRMRPTKNDWKDLLSTLSDIIGEKIEEIHTRDFYSGNGKWRNLEGGKRAKIINAIFNWLRERKHNIVFTAVDKKKFEEEENNCNLNLWQFMALHLILSLQKCYQGKIKDKKERKVNPKGQFLLVFDKEDREVKNFVELVINPPDWTDDYYEKKEKQEKISQLIDVPHFVDSKHVPLIQLADFISYFLRRYIELETNSLQEKYNGEKNFIENLANIIFERSIPFTNIHNTRKHNEVMKIFNKYLPSVVNNHFTKGK